MIKSFLRLPSFNLAQSSPLGGAALSHTVHSFHFNQVPLQRTIVFLYRWRQTEPQRLHTIKKNKCLFILDTITVKVWTAAAGPASDCISSSFSLSEFLHFCERRKLSYFRFVLSKKPTRRRSSATFIQINDFGLWAHVGLFSQQVALVV